MTDVREELSLVDQPCGLRRVDPPRVLGGLFDRSPLGLVVRSAIGAVRRWVSEGASP